MHSRDFCPQRNPTSEVFFLCLSAQSCAGKNKRMSKWVHNVRGPSNPGWRSWAIFSQEMAFCVPPLAILIYLAFLFGLDHNYLLMGFLCKCARGDCFRGIIHRSASNSCPRTCSIAAYLGWDELNDWRKREFLGSSFLLPVVGGWGNGWNWFLRK
jgi:hypothetical protein